MDIHKLILKKKTELKVIERFKNPTKKTTIIMLWI